MKKKSIDIILITYNQEKYIAGTLEDILAQKIDADVRIIVADDYSSDNTLKIIKDYDAKSEFPFVYLSNEKNLGMKMNYKRAFNALTADYTAIMEGDDAWNENHLRQHLDFHRRHRGYSMSSNIYNYFQDGIEPDYNAKGTYSVSYDAIWFRDTLFCGNLLGNLSACFFRTEYLKSLPEELFEYDFADWELSMILASKRPIARLYECTSAYRINRDGQWTSKENSERSKSYFATMGNVNHLLGHKYDKIFSEAIDLMHNGPYPTPFISRRQKFKNTVKAILHR